MYIFTSDQPATYLQGQSFPCSRRIKNKTPTRYHLILFSFFLLPFENKESLKNGILKSIAVSEGMSAYCPNIQRENRTLYLQKSDKERVMVLEVIYSGFHQTLGGIKRIIATAILNIKCFYINTKTLLESIWNIQVSAALNGCILPLYILDFVERMELL